MGGSLVINVKRKLIAKMGQNKVYCFFVEIECENNCPGEQYRLYSITFLTQS